MDRLATKGSSKNYIDSFRITWDRLATKGSPKNNIYPIRITLDRLITEVLRKKKYIFTSNDSRHIKIFMLKYIINLNDRMRYNMEKKIVMALNSADKKIFFEPQFDDMPSGLKEELKAGIIKLTDQVKGIIVVSFNENGNLIIEHQDAFPDEINVDYVINEFLNSKTQLLKSLKIWYLIYKTKEGKLAREALLKPNRPVR